MNMAVQSPFAGVAGAVLNALPHPVVMIEPDGRLAGANQAAEVFFQNSTSVLTRYDLGREDAGDLSFFPAMNLPRQRKLEVVNDALQLLTAHFAVGTVGAHAEAAARSPRLPAHDGARAGGAAATRWGSSQVATLRAR